MHFWANQKPNNQINNTIYCSRVAENMLCLFKIPNSHYAEAEQSECVRNHQIRTNNNTKTFVISICFIFATFRKQLEYARCLLPKLSGAAAAMSIQIAAFAKRCVFRSDRQGSSAANSEWRHVFLDLCSDKVFFFWVDRMTIIEWTWSVMDNPMLCNDIQHGWVVSLHH